jgi:TPR repeat protein
MYAYGQLVPQDFAAAMSWYRKAAEQGHAEAQNELGWMYAYGPFVPQDYAEAVRWSQVCQPGGRRRAVQAR